MEKKIVFGGGCFWCTEAMFQELNGVSSVTSGYSGGHKENPTYQDICYTDSGHAEVIKVTYNPEIISYQDLVMIHLTTHDPTTINQQGGDRGPQYRSVIFYQSEEEHTIAKKVINEVQSAYSNPIVTELAPGSKFYEAEEEHQDYYNRNNLAGYCQAVIDPKLAKFRQLHKTRLRQ
jgi:peptide methionine sulfoxide reductase msrA/msrB